jgi:hypothetical protein
MNLNIKLIIRIILLFTVIVISAIQSFSQNNVSVLQGKEQLYTASKSLILKNDQYIFDISENNAKELGISKSYYAQILKDIEEINNTIKKVKNNPEIITCFADPNSQIQNESDSLRTEIIISSLKRVKGMSSFVIDVPANTSKIKIEASVSAIVSYIDLKISNTGGNDISTLLVSTFLNPAVIDIQLPVKYPYVFAIEALIQTNRMATITFKVETMSK